MELKSLTQRIKCIKVESRILRIFLESLVYSSMRLGVPFIAPRQLGVVGDQFGRPSLPSIVWCTGKSGAPADNHCSCPVRDLLPYRSHPTVAPRDRMVSGAPSRPLERAMCYALITWTTIALGAVGSPDSPLHHQTVG
jgi:hypothetical protein